MTTEETEPYAIALPCVGKGRAEGAGGGQEPIEIIGPSSPTLSPRRRGSVPSALVVGAYAALRSQIIRLVMIHDLAACREPDLLARADMGQCLVEILAPVRMAD